MVQTCFYRVSSARSAFLCMTMQNSREKHAKLKSSAFANFKLCFHVHSNFTNPLWLRILFAMETKWKKEKKLICIPPFLPVQSQLHFKWVLKLEWKFIWTIFFFSQLINVSPRKGGYRKIVYRLVNCPSPRKSLVKGERFIRGMKRNQSYRTRVVPL